MGKPHRSPLLGYNHNIQHLGRVFHVQTEDSGPANPRLFTHLFYEGTILVSMKLDYEAAAADDRVRALMKTQHKTMIRDLTQAQHDNRIVTFFRARGVDLLAAQGATPKAVMPEAQPTASLPVVLADPSDTAPEPVVLANGAASAPPAPAPAEPAVPAAAAAAEPAAGPSRRATRAIETQRPRSAPAPVMVVRPTETRRAPFVRSGAPAMSTTSSTDGVVVQRSRVVGGTPAVAPSRPGRTHTQSPYVVSGGSPAQPAAGATGRATQAFETIASVSAPAAVPVPATLVPAPPAPPTPPAPAPVSAVEAPRPSVSFGGGLVDDKSLDEVILEYLSEDE
jgi:hypothetical protein